MMQNTGSPVFLLGSGCLACLLDETAHHVGRLTGAVGLVICAAELNLQPGAFRLARHLEGSQPEPEPVVVNQPGGGLTYKTLLPLVVQDVSTLALKNPHRIVWCDSLNSVVLDILKNGRKSFRDYAAEKVNQLSRVEHGSRLG